MSLFTPHSSDEGYGYRTVCRAPLAGEGPHTHLRVRVYWVEAHTLDSGQKHAAGYWAAVTPVTCVPLRSDAVDCLAVRWTWLELADAPGARMAALPDPETRERLLSEAAAALGRELPSNTPMEPK
jgi:hypothetical protein